MSNNYLNTDLTCFMPLVSFYIPPENQRFSDVFRGKEKDQWHEMD